MYINYVTKKYNSPSSGSTLKRSIIHVGKHVCAGYNRRSRSIAKWEIIIYDLIVLVAYNYIHCKPTHEIIRPN